MRHGEIFRRESDITIDEMATLWGKSPSHIKNFKRSLDLLLTGSLPETASMAMTNSYVYRELKNFPCTPQLARYVNARLHALKAINSEVNVSDPLQQRALVCTPNRDAVKQGGVCPECRTTRPCFCE